ncbi:MAG: ATP-binding protein [Spirochaetota bacterium]
MKRVQLPLILKDLGKKMVFLIGPRQVGKSWLAKAAMEAYHQPLYLNWDQSSNRDIILSQSWPPFTDLLVLDEIHKMPEWKNYLKGLYDTKATGLHILVTGSARLDTFRRGGDSLAGRFFAHRLLPLSPAEAHLAGEKRDLSWHVMAGGFPEPWLAESEAEVRRWRNQYLDGLIRDDILEFGNILQLKAMNALVRLLRERVGSLLSFQGLAEDLHISPNTVAHYLEILEALFVVFRIMPHRDSVARSLAARQKLYFLDTGLVEGDIGKRLENLVAVSLLKRCWYLEELDGIRRELRFLRNKEGKEVDFYLHTEGGPGLMVEVKSSERSLSPNLRYFHERGGFPGIQLVAAPVAPYDKDGLSVRDLFGWLEGLEA